MGEVGSHTSRFGYGGEDAPRLVTPSYGYTMSTSGDSSSFSSTDWKPLMSPYRSPPCSEARNPMRLASPSQSAPWSVDPAQYLSQGDGLFHDEDAMEGIWQYAMNAMHVRNPNKHTSRRSARATAVISSETLATRKAKHREIIPHPLLAVSPGKSHVVRNSSSNKQDSSSSPLDRQLARMTEIMMEKLDCPALFVAPAPMLAAFSQGRQSALVVDLGASGCCVTPVVDGLCLKQSQRRNGRGGDWLANVQWKALVQHHEQKPIVRPRYLLKTTPPPSVSERGIFHRWAMADLMHEFRTSGQVSLPRWRYDPTVPFLGAASEEEEDAAPVSMDPQHMYELPDGTLIHLSTQTGRDLCRVPELLFTDQIPFVSIEESSSTLSQHPTLSNLPLEKLVYDSLAAVTDTDARKLLAGNILLTGGSSRFPSLEQRLSLEVSTLVSGAYKTKVLAPMDPIERSCASWIGGSILSSLGSFQQLWLSRAEYEEYGATLAIQRFP